MATKIGTNSRVDWSKVKEKQEHQFCIAIPAYKEDLNIDEVISLKRLRKVLKRKDNVYLFCPFRLDITEYKKIFPEIQAIGFNTENFTSIDAYSHLCMKYEFYDAFSSYEYMLIYQLDCYLMCDNIGDWCSKGYDYVGAPILVPHHDWKNFRYNSDQQMVFTPSVGNGGFSLRKIETFKFLTDPNGELRRRYGLTDEALANVKYEDVYFCVVLGGLYEIERPDWSEAIKFCIDMNPDVAFGKFGLQEYPMCIHAFDKNIPFWRDKIVDFDDDQLYEYCVKKNEKFITEYYLNKNE